MSKTIVIGSNCFSASDYIDLLLEEGRFDVIGVSRSPEKDELFLPYLKRDRSRFRFERIDFNKEPEALAELIERERPDYIVNFAALSEVATSWEHPVDYYETNAVSLCRFLKPIQQAPYLKRYVQISTPEVYGTCEGRVTEDAPFNPSTPYAASKAAGDLYLMTLSKQFQFPVSFIRATNVYGAHQQLYKIIPRTAIYIRMGKKIPLHGGGRAVKSFIHIRDVSRGELAAMEQGRTGAIYHLSPGRGYEVREIVERICTIMGASFGDAVDIVDERPGQDAAYVIDSSRARSEFGWSDRISLDEGVEGVLEWIDRHWPRIQQEPLQYEHVF